MRGVLGFAGVLATAASLVLAPQAAAAAYVDVTIAYSCTIPIFGAKTLNVEVSANIPTTATVGVPIQLTGVSVTVPLSADVYESFTPFGATQIDGTAGFELVVHAQGETIHLPVAGVVPLTPIPDPPGPDMLLPASGSVPPFTLHSPGSATIAAGQGFTLHFTPRDAGGGATILGTLDVPCTATGSTFMATIDVS